MEPRLADTLEATEAAQKLDDVEKTVDDTVAADSFLQEFPLDVGFLSSMPLLDPSGVRPMDVLVCF